MGQRQLVPARRLHPVARAAYSVGLATVEFPRLRAAWATVSGCGARPSGGALAVGPSTAGWSAICSVPTIAVG